MLSASKTLTPYNTTARGKPPDELSFAIFQVIERYPEGVLPGEIAQILDVPYSRVYNRAGTMGNRGLLIWEDEYGRWGAMADKTGGLYQEWQARQDEQ